MNILVLDVGTSSMRGLLMTHNGKELAKEQIFYRPCYKSGGIVEQSSEDWKNALYMIVKEISKKAAEEGWKIEAISMTSQRSSVIPVDVHMKPLGNAVMWQDKRANEICEILQPENERIFSLCGSRLNPVFSAGKMAWIKKNQPKRYSDTYKFMVIPDFLNYLMTGNICTDYTYGSRSLLMNLGACRWDPVLLGLFGIEEKKLCPLVEPGSVCGVTSTEFSKITGCAEGIPVITAGGDQQCSAVGQGVIKRGILSVTVGTGGYLEATTEKIPENLRSDIVCNIASVKNQYILESSVLTCCSAFDWFRKEFYENVNYEQINKTLALVPPGSNGCLCLPYFQGRSTPDWNNKAKGMFANITLATTKRDMLRSILEGIAYEIANGIESMKKYTEIVKVYVNGGLTESEVFNEIQCNVYGTEIIRRGKADATARGALMIAATTLGIYENVEEAFDEIGGKDKIKVYNPSPEIETVYAKCREEMNQTYKKMWY